MFTWLRLTDHFYWGWWFWRMWNAIGVCAHFTSHFYFHCKGPAFPFLNLSWVPSSLCWKKCTVSTWPAHLIVTNVSLSQFLTSYCVCYDFIMWHWTKLPSTVTDFRESLELYILLQWSPWLSHAELMICKSQKKDAVWSALHKYWLAHFFGIHWVRSCFKKLLSIVQVKITWEWCPSIQCAT